MNSVDALRSLIEDMLKEAGSASRARIGVACRGGGGAVGRPNIGFADALGDSRLKDSGKPAVEAAIAGHRSTPVRETAGD